MAYLYFFLTANIPDRAADWKESLELIAIGWGSIFIVTFIAIGSIYALHKIFHKK